MRTDTPKTIYLKDYKPYPFTVQHVDLDVQIYEGKTIVTAKTRYKSSSGGGEDLILNGEALKLLSFKKDGQDAKPDIQGDLLILDNPGDEFELEIVTEIEPEKNTRLEGLYQSGGIYCTQCEAEGFRRITYYPDRPDVLATYTVRVEGDKESLPVLLSNGELEASGDTDNGRHYTLWNDTTPKPCYLFALVAGKLNKIQDRFTTMSGKDVDLLIYVRPGDETQCDHAMDSLKRSMKWDEDVYGREYQYSLFNIVAVSDFNMGAMENTSLNIFNTALVLAHQDTATDADFMRVEGVIAHEYFHNWSGNRVTCRDWFQLSLKEGLTVFRDQEFSADTHSRAVQRIDDVQLLRRMQFPEDAGPLAHPIRPDNYIEINNFYTMTVYEKGAEVIRMIRTLLGPENYRKGTDLYFERHDGQAVTCDDFVQAMQDASGVDLSQFKLWYSQAGTPRITFSGLYNPEKQEYVMTFSQDIPDTPGQSNKKPMHIPIAVGLIDRDGNDLIGTEVLHLREQTQDFVFSDISSEPIPSVLRNFSAPVILKHDLDEEQMNFIRQHDSDGFNRWEAGQVIAAKAIHHMLDNGEKNPPDSFINGLSPIVDKALDKEADKALCARALQLPDMSSLIQQRELADPVAIYKARQKALAAIKREYRKPLETIYKENEDKGSFSITADAVAKRTLRNTALLILTSTYGTGCAKRAKKHYLAADNMTDRIAALASLAPNKNPEHQEIFDAFYERYKDYPLVIDKWFALQAAAPRDDSLRILHKLREHPDFNIKNPNRVRSLFGSFAMHNELGFHAKDGSGYTFLAEGIKKLNGINPQIAARLLNPFRSWRQYSVDRQELMKQALEDILTIKNISPDVFEVAKKSLDG